MTNKEKLQEATQNALLGKLVEKVIDDVDEVENIMSRHTEFILEEKNVFSIRYNYKNIKITFNTEYNHCEIDLGRYIKAVAIKNGYREDLKYELAKIEDFINLIKNIFKDTIDEIDEFLDLEKNNILNNNFEKYILRLKNSLDSFLNYDIKSILKQYGTKLKPAITEKQFMKIANNVQKIILDKYNVKVDVETYKSENEKYDEGWALKYVFREKEVIIGVAGTKQGTIGIFTGDNYYPYEYLHDDTPNYLKDIQEFLISYIDDDIGSIIEKEKQAELNKTRLRYNIVYYLNTATRERREETREDVDDDYCNTVEYFDTDLEAFEYVMTDILEIDPEDYYDNEETDEEKIKTIINYFQNQDYGDGEVIICKVVGKNYKYNSGLTKKSFLDMASGNY